MLPLRCTLELATDNGQVSTLAKIGRGAAVQLSSDTGNGGKSGGRVAEWLALWDAAVAATIETSISPARATSSVTAIALSTADEAKNVAYACLHKGRWDEVHRSWRTAFACSSVLVAALLHPSDQN